jgi:ABC-type phosphonate transport system ATPase subunit
MNQYEIHIGEILDLTNNSKKPKHTLIITQDQLAIIEQFASQRKDAELNTIYKLNECEFRILLHFDFGAAK